MDSWLFHGFTASFACDLGVLSQSPEQVSNNADPPKEESGGPDEFTDLSGMEENEAPLVLMTAL